MVKKDGKWVWNTFVMVWVVAPQGSGVAILGRTASCVFPPPLEKLSFAKSAEHRRSCRPPAAVDRQNVEGIGGSCPKIQLLYWCYICRSWLVPRLLKCCKQLQGGRQKEGTSRNNLGTGLTTQKCDHFFIDSKPKSVQWWQCNKERIWKIIN